MNNNKLLLKNISNIHTKIINFIVYYFLVTIFYIKLLKNWNNIYLLSLLQINFEEISLYIVLITT